MKLRRLNRSHWGYARTIDSVLLGSTRLGSMRREISIIHGEKVLVGAPSYIATQPNFLFVAAKGFVCGNKMIWLWQPNDLVVTTKWFGCDNQTCGHHNHKFDFHNQSKVVATTITFDCHNQNIWLSNGVSPSCRVRVGLLRELLLPLPRNEQRQFEMKGWKIRPWNLMIQVYLFDFSLKKK